MTQAQTLSRELQLVNYQQENEMSFQQMKSIKKLGLDEFGCTTQSLFLDSELLNQEFEKM